MSSSSSSDDYPTGSSVPFPYENPYPQQVDLMETLLSSLKEKQKKVLLLESPTGTGKSLSLACAAMAWLRYTEQQDLLEMTDAPKEKTTAADDDDDWLGNYQCPEERQRQEDATAVRTRATTSREALTRELSTLTSKLVNKTTNLVEVRENLVRSAVTTAKMKERRLGKFKKRKTKKAVIQEDFCVDDYRSDEEPDSDLDETIATNDKDAAGSTESVLNLLDGSCLDGSSAVHGSQAIGNVKPSQGVRKIIYAARTHSQLSQFVGELRRIPGNRHVRVVALGGRSVLCGNSDVNRKGRSEHAITEACLDMSKSKTQSCPLKASKEGMGTLALHLLAQPSDIEDAARLGKASHSCAYYATRQSLGGAEVVVMPYSMLLSESARQAVGLSLKECLVLVDEAHNLPEAIRSLHSCRLSLPVAEASLEQLIVYTKRYADRLAGRNLYYLGQLRKCLNAIIQHLKQEKGKVTNKLISPGELLVDLNLDNINLFKVIAYMERSRLAQKLLGFTSAVSKPDETGLSKHVSSLSVVQTFLSKLTLSSKEGKLVTEYPKPTVADSRSAGAQHPTLRFVSLHPAACFENVMNEARAVALVGGTLSPFGHVATELLPADYIRAASSADEILSSKPNNEISKTFTSTELSIFTCDHVVSSSNVLLERLSTGPSNVKLDFRHSSRSKPPVMDELGRALVRMAKIVPAGMVVFLPSYSYEAQLVSRWKQTSIWDELNRCKRVHREPKKSAQVEATLVGYSRDAKSRGALLLSVVGGKMSEGINFANEMARSVVVVGLPYADITDPELKEKMTAMDQSKGGISGQDYYHNLCMRAVNQSVGRAIRHATDYATIVLADARYVSDARVWRSLPSWLKRGTIPQSNSFSKSIGNITTFFAGITPTAK